MATKFDDYASQSPEKALEFLKRAFVRRNPLAAFRLGEWYLKNDQTTPGRAKALEMFNKSILWSLNVPFVHDCHVRAVGAILAVGKDKEAIIETESRRQVACQEAINHIRSLYYIPFVGTDKQRVEELIVILSDIFRGDVSFDHVKTLLESKDYSALLESAKNLIEPLNVMYDLYPKLCKKYMASAKALNGVQVIDFYPFISFETVYKVAEDVAMMFLTLRGTQNDNLTALSFSLDDDSFLTSCERCKDEYIQLFMISIIEIKIALDDYFIELWNLYKALRDGDYDRVSSLLSRNSEVLSAVHSNLNFEPHNIENIIPHDMFDQKQSSSDDDFDKLLEEFIARELQGGAPFDRNNTNTNDNSYPLNIEQVNLAYDFNAEDGVKASAQTHFRKSHGDNLHVDIILDNSAFNEESWGASIIAELVTCGGVVLARSELCAFVSSDEQRHTLSFSFNKLALAQGEYHLVLYSNGDLISSNSFQVDDLPYPYAKCFDFEGFGIYRIDDELSVGQQSQNCFDVKGLCGICVVAFADNILPQEYRYQFILRIYNELGVEIVTQSTEDSVGDKDSEQKILHINENTVRELWERGTYKAEVEFLGEVIACAEFVIGDRDISAMYHKKSVQPKTNIGGREIVQSVENPMAKLDAMVGLADVKREIRAMASKIAMDKKRAINGLKTKSVSLHAAFLGNPGTGKTTVAKLLGQIYKDIGLLSKGHVVVEERSTLMGQNWGSEGEMTNKAIEKAKGGILFIDEAYDLVTDHPQDPGRLIISSLLSSLADENNRDWMLILAGYPAPMDKLLNVNEGLRSRLQRFDFKDFTAQELMMVADGWLAQNDYIMTDDARRAFEAQIDTALTQKESQFGNARFVCDMFEKQIVPTMSARLMSDCIVDSVDALKTIEYVDIPNSNKQGNSDITISKLETMVGLGELKSKINSHLDFVRFVNLRRNCGIATTIPPLHMVFTGNPGTGKTTVADYLGEIYKSMGLLSIGRVIKVSRADMIGRYGDTEQTMKALLSSAKGNILFIDEAYTLLSENPSDPGRRAVDMLLDALSKESVDMIVIMAGYPKEMEALLKSNQGLAGRFPYKFEFEDYSVEDLMKIAQGVCEKSNLILSGEAKEAVGAIIKKEYRVKDNHFSNARFVVRLITTQIMPNMGRRIANTPGTKDEMVLKTVLAEDVPIGINEVKQINNNLFDEEAIKKALDRLDALVGLSRVKRAIHEFVDISREMSLQNRKFIGNYPLKWSFSGNSGTGKSTVAEILSEILKAMYLLGKGHLVEVKAEELYAVNTHQADELIKKRMMESQQGLLFVDGDAPQFRSPESRYNPEYLRMCLAANTIEMPGTYAIVIAEHESPRQLLVRSLDKIGITDFDHTLLFDDYSQDELLEILKLHLSKSDLVLEANAEAIMFKYIGGLCGSRRADYANARTMKLLARSIHKLTLLAKEGGGRVTSKHLADFASIAAIAPKRVGY